MRSSPGIQSASVIAARRVQRPSESAQTPLPVAASGVSAVLLTTKVRLSAARAWRAAGRCALALRGELGLQVDDVDAAVAVGVAAARRHRRGAGLAGHVPIAAHGVEVLAVEAAVVHQVAGRLRGARRDMARCGRGGSDDVGQLADPERGELH